MLPQQQRFRRVQAVDLTKIDLVVRRVFVAVFRSVRKKPSVNHWAKFVNKTVDFLEKRYDSLAAAKQIPSRYPAGGRVSV